MEIELKCKIEDANFDLWKAIMKEYVLQDIQKVKMDAVYYDTFEDDFLEQGIALRIRTEDNKRVATVKTRGSSVNGLHSRQEWNKDVSDTIDISFTKWFMKTSIGEKLDKIIKEQPLKEKIRTVFIRKKAIMNYSGSQFEVAVDKGKIIAGSGKEEIYEFEVELIKGDKASIKAFGNELMSKYNIQPENISKYARGLKLLNPHVDVL